MQKVARLRDLLVGNDKRSVARAEQALKVVSADNRRVWELAALANDRDPLVSTRAVDLLEKLARKDASRVQPYKRVLIGPLADTQIPEIKLQIARALPLLKWTPAEREKVLSILHRYVKDDNKAVKSWALDALSHFAMGDPELTSKVLAIAKEFEKKGTKAMGAKARVVKKRLTGKRS